MSLSFFENPYKQTSSAKRFGPCDDIAATDCPKTPAYIDEENDEEWTAEVLNKQQKVVDFYPIDNCIEIRRSNGEIDNRCDGMLLSNERLMFVELKDRNSHNWIAKGREQLEVTISNFKQVHNIGDFKCITAHLCNKQRPRAVVACPNELQKFYDNTGYRLYVDRNINI